MPHSTVSDLVLQWSPMSHKTNSRLICASTRAKTCLRGFANKTGKLKSIISILAKNEISIFELVSVAEQAGLNLTLSETKKTERFVRGCPTQL